MPMLVYMKLCPLMVCLIVVRVHWNEGLKFEFVLEGRLLFLVDPLLNKC